MKISPETITEYQQIHFQEFGVKLTEEKAEELARRWLSTFSLIFNSNEYEKRSIAP